MRFFIYTTFKDNSRSAVDWTKKAVFMASNDYYWISEGTHNYVISNYMEPEGYTSEKLYVYTYGATATQVVNAFNAGRMYGVYSGHGSQTSWSDGPPLSQGQVQSLTNEYKLPLVFSFACLTGQFNYASECFGETWLRESNKAAVGFYGSSNSTYWDEDDVLEKKLFSSIYDEIKTSFGGMTVEAKVKFIEYYSIDGYRTKYYLETYNILGDPSLNYPYLYNYANSNKSLNYHATSYNNNHIIEKDASGRLHFVFQSGGEIFYRRSTNTGSAWDITRRISDGGGSYDAPSIAVAYDGSLQAVWQQKMDNYNYRIWYSRSSDIGSTWTAPLLISNTQVSYYQSNAGSGQGSTPVIAAMNGSQTKLLCVWAQSDGLKYIAGSSTSEWLEYLSTVPGTLNNTTVWHPSLATNGIGASSANMIYDDRFSAVYSQRYDGNVSPGAAWSSQTTAAYGSADRLSSIAINPWGGMYGVWSYWNGDWSQWLIRYRYGDAASNSWGWMWEFFDLDGLHSFYPVVSHFENPADYHYIQFLWSAYGGGPYRTEMVLYDWYNDMWNSPSPFSGNGIFANMTHEWYAGNYPTRSWTDLTSSPYQIEVLTSGFYKTGGLTAQKESKPYRAVEIFDRKNRVKFTLKLSGLNFKKYDYRQKLDLNLSNVFDYLQTETFVPNAGNTLTVQASTTVTQQDTLADGKVSTQDGSKFRGIELSLQVVNGTSKIGEIPFLSGGQPNNQVQKTFALDQFESKSVALVPKVILGGDYDEKDLSFTLVNGVEGAPSPNVESAIEVLPNDVALGQNFPNPFNPTTTIAYRVSRPGKVSLKIFDVLGREVATLVNTIQNEGVYTRRFDATHLSSGIYFYQLVAPDVNETKKMLIAK
jgi:hypothetical protein